MKDIKMRVIVVNIKTGIVEIYAGVSEIYFTEVSTEVKVVLNKTNSAELKMISLRDYRVIAITRT